MTKPFKIYYTLFIRYEGKWEQYFGSYDKSDCDYEKDYSDMRVGDTKIPKKDMKIVQHYPSDQRMLQVLAELNAKENA